MQIDEMEHGVSSASVLSTSHPGFQLSAGYSEVCQGIAKQPTFYGRSQSHVPMWPPTHPFIRTPQHFSILEHIPVLQIYNSFPETQASNISNYTRVFHQPCFQLQPLHACVLSTQLTASTRIGNPVT